MLTDRTLSVILDVSSNFPVKRLKNQQCLKTSNSVFPSPTSFAFTTRHRRFEHRSNKIPIAKGRNIDQHPPTAQTANII